MKKTPAQKLRDQLAQEDDEATQDAAEQAQTARMAVYIALPWTTESS